MYEYVDVLEERMANCIHLATPFFLYLYRKPKRKWSVTWRLLSCCLWKATPEGSMSRSSMNCSESTRDSRPESPNIKFLLTCRWNSSKTCNRSVKSFCLLEFQLFEIIRSFCSFVYTAWQAYWNNWERISSLRATQRRGKSWDAASWAWGC